MNNNKNSKITFISFLQNFGIILVVAGHSFPDTTVDMPVWVIWFQGLIYSFHMPLFFFISGYLFYVSESRQSVGIIKSIKNKAYRLLFPFAILSTLAFFPKLILSNLATRPLENTWGGFFKIFFIPELNPIVFFWFIEALFLIFLFAYIFSRIPLGKFKPIILTVLVISVIPLQYYLPQFFALNAAAGKAIFFAAGCLFRRSEHRLAFLSKFSYCMLFLGLLLLILNIPREFAFSRYLIPCLGVFAALCGIAFSVVMAKLLENYNQRFFGIIDGFNYQIFLLSWFFAVPIRILYELNHLGWSITVFLRFICGLFLPIVVVHLFKSFLPWANPIIGLPYRKKIKSSDNVNHRVETREPAVVTEKVK